MKKYWLVLVLVLGVALAACNHRRIAAQYDAAYDNAFQAKHVGPSDLPRPAPGLDQAIGSYCQ